MTTVLFSTVFAGRLKVAQSFVAVPHHARSSKDEEENKITGSPWGVQLEWTHPLELIRWPVFLLKNVFLLPLFVCHSGCSQKTAPLLAVAYPV